MQKLNLRILVSTCTLTVLTLGANNTLAQTSKNDLQKMDLKGSVKSLVESEYKTALVNGKVQKRYKHQSIDYQFNKDGFLTTETTIEGHVAGIEERSEYLYDCKNKLALIKEYGQYGKLSSTHFFSYDSLGNRIQDYIAHPIDDDPKQNTKYVYSYDERGNCTELSGYDTKGQFFTKYTYNYDSLDRKTQEVWLEANGDTIYINTYRYNAKGKKTEEIHEYKSDMGGEYKITFKYDGRGNLIEESSGGMDGSVTTHSVYTLDSHGNWIKMDVTEDGKPLYMAERKITYF